jgi:hypothetical protein
MDQSILLYGISISNNTINSSNINSRSSSNSKVNNNNSSSSSKSNKTITILVILSVAIAYQSFHQIMTVTKPGEEEGLMVQVMSTRGTINQGKGYYLLHFEIIVFINGVMRRYNHLDSQL